MIELLHPHNRKGMKKVFVILLTSVAVLKSIAQTCYPLDNGFGINGQSIGFVSTTWNEASIVIVQPDNKIVQFSSNSANGFTTVRYKANGGLDSSFGQNGRISMAMGYGCQVFSGSLQTDGKIVVAGAAYVNNYRKIGLIRLNSNGAPDLSFGNGGIVTTSLSSQNDEARSVIVQPDGKIIVAGYSSGNCFTDCIGLTFCKPLFTVLRYNNSGTVDSSFGQNGKIAFGIGQFNSGRAAAVSIQTDGKIVVAGENLEYYCDDYYGGGTNSSGFFMTRLNPNGTVDASFGQNGQVRDTMILMNTTSFTIQPDGKFLAVGYRNGGGYIVRRFESNGTPDNSFIQSPYFTEWITSMSLLPNGKIVLGGSSWTNAQQQLFLARLKSNGQFDSSFNLTGKITIQPGTTSPNNQRVTGVAVQGSDLIAGGFSTIYSSGYTFNQFVFRLADPLTGLAVPVTPSGSLFPCQGSGVTLSTSVQGNYQWYKDNQQITWATNSAYYAATSGNYSVSVTNASGCGHSDPTTVSINGLPVFIIPSGSTNICLGDSVQLKSNETGPQQWFYNNNPIANAMTQFTGRNCRGTTMFQ